MKYKMIVFDLDGTLLNTIEDLCNACNYGLNQYNLKNISIQETMLYLGHGIRHLVYEASKHSSYTEELLTVFRKYYSLNYNGTTKPYPGIDEVLEFCKRNHLILGVLTNKVEDIAQNLCKAHFGNQFDFVYGDKEGRQKKPNPDFFLQLLKEYKLSCKEVLYIGDSEVDIDFSRAAGVDGLFVSYGFRTKQSLLEKSDFVVDTPQDIVNFLKR